jgi:Pectate lyase superfamily protein/Right handed beta helix region
MTSPSCGPRDSAPTKPMLLGENWMRAFPFSSHAGLVSAVLVAGICLSTAASGQPQIYWASDPVNPGDSVLVSGDGLSDVMSVGITRLADTKDEPSRAPGTDEIGAAKPIQANNQSVKFVIPDSLRRGVFEYKLTAQGGSRESCLNCATIYWAQGDLGTRSSPGGWIRILGRNIARSRDATLSLASINHKGIPERLQPEAWDLWDASFAVPSSTSPGSYLLRLWNGEGDNSTWRDAGMITIEVSPAPPSDILNARDYGAVGDGVHDDTAAVKRALAVLREKGGGTLFFTRGRYVISDALVLSDHVAIKGEGRELVSLNWPELPAPPPSLIAGYSDFSVSDITLYASNYASIISGGFQTSLDEKAEKPAANISVKRVTIRASAYRGHISPQQAMNTALVAPKTSIINGPATIRLTGENLVLTDSDIYGSGGAFLLLDPRGAYVARNTFSNGRDGFYSITGADGVIFENNEIVGADPQGTGGGINTLGDKSSSCRNVLFRQNVFKSMYGWDREAITSDGPGGYYFGRIRAVKNDKVELLDSPTQSYFQRDVRGAGLFVVGGKGSGQYARIVSVAGLDVLLDRPLVTGTTEASIATIVPLQENVLIIENQFSDAGVAAQFYGTSVNHVVANNVSARTGGFLNQGSYYHHFQPSWYVQFLDNRIEEGSVYRGGPNNAVFSGEAVIGSYGMQTSNLPPFVLGTIIRRNVLKNNAHIEVKGMSYKFPGTRDVVIEHNSIAKANAGVVVDRGAANVLIRENTFQQVTNEIQDNSQ